MATNKLGLLPSQPSQNQVQDSSLSAPIATYRNWLKAGEVMSEDIATIDPQSTVASAARIMSGGKISCLIVSSDGHLSGIITETDILKKVATVGHKHYVEVVIRIATEFAVVLGGALVALNTTYAAVVLDLFTVK